ncbi:MAG: hypothetical protein KJ737_01680 [Proteobacteria bacterium]|nr:hypothetical protein [Pseudomonadota bacterium]
MALLQTISKENADGEVKTIYDGFMEKVGMIPKPFELLSVSPELMKIQAGSLTYFMGHPTLGFPLLSHIRYMVAVMHNYAYCTDLNKNFLKMQGLQDADVENLTRDPSQTMLEDKDKAMLLFVLKAIKNPDSVEERDIAGLHDMGWKDRDIFDALTHGVSMVGHSVLMKAFKMDTCNT